jgi:hypothetical protein
MTDEQTAQIITLLTAILGQLELTNAIIDMDIADDLERMETEGSA